MWQTKVRIAGLIAAYVVMGSATGLTGGVRFAARGHAADKDML